MEIFKLHTSIFFCLNTLLLSIHNLHSMHKIIFLTKNTKYKDQENKMFKKKH